MTQGADLLSLAEGVAPPGAGVAGGAASTSDDGPGKNDSDFARRVRTWFLSDVSHQLWSTYTKQADIDEGFYIGGAHQWVDDNGNKDDYDSLRLQKRATISINQIKPIIKVLTGLERQTRFDTKILPQGEEDEDDAKIMSWLFKFVSNNIHIPEMRSIAFKQALIRGMSVLHCGMTWDDNPISGEIVGEALTPGRDCIWDPHWTQPDFSDASHFLRYRWVWIRDVIAQYDERKKEIEAAVGDLNQILADLSQTGGVSRGYSGDAYGGVVSPHVDELNADRYFYDKQLQRVLVVEAWYPDYETRWHLYHKDSGKLEEVPEDMPKPGQFAIDSQRASGDQVQAIKRVRRYMRTGTVLPAVNVTLEEDETPYVNDRQSYPYTLVIGERTADDIRGIVRDLRDAQRVENKRVSQAIDLVSRWGKIRRVAEENSISPQSEGLMTDPLGEGVIYYRVGKQPPGWDVPQGIADLTRLIVGLADQMKVSIKETSGVNSDLLGQRGGETASGIAIARRQAQGQIIATEVFDQNRWSGEIFGRQLGRRIQQKFTKEEYVRLTNDFGSSVMVHLNPPAVNRVKDKDERRNSVKEWRKLAAIDPSKPEILANVDKFKWDLVLSETPSSPTARSEALETLMKMVERMPAILPVVMDTVIRLTDGLPDKPELLARVKQLQMAQGIGGPPPGGPPGMPGGGGPPALPPPTQGVSGVNSTRGETPQTVAPPPAPTPPPHGVG
jgi:hypothetical protein